jgi:hypothetical protein
MDGIELRCYFHITFDVLMDKYEFKDEDFEIVKKDYIKNNTTLDIVLDKINLKGVINVYIGRGLARLFFFYYIKCKFFFITLTDLDNYYLKKSKRVYKYIYIFHSPISLNKSYTPNAFDNYDIFFSIGSMQTQEFLKIFGVTTIL